MRDSAQYPATGQGWTREGRAEREMAENRVTPLKLLRRYVKAHHISRAALVASGIVAVLLFFVVGVGIRLLIGPVSLGPFAGSLADAIDRALPGISVKYDQAAIEWE